MRTMYVPFFFCFSLLFLIHETRFVLRIEQRVVAVVCVLVCDLFFLSAFVSAFNDILDSSRGRVFPLQSWRVFRDCIDNNLE